MIAEAQDRATDEARREERLRERLSEERLRERLRRVDRMSEPELRQHVSHLDEGLRMQAEEAAVLRQSLRELDGRLAEVMEPAVVEASSGFRLRRWRFG